MSLGSLFVIAVFVLILIGLIDQLRLAIKKIRMYDELKPKYDKLNDDIKKMENREKRIKTEIEKKEKDLEKEKVDYQKKCELEIHKRKKEIEFERRDIEKERKDIERIINEKTKGFPWLAVAFSEYYHLKNLKQARFLERKKHPAIASAQKVRTIAKERRTIEKKLRIAQRIIDYHYELFPFLQDFYDIEDDEILEIVLSRDIEKPIDEVDEIGIDPVRTYLSKLSKEEYNKLPTTERNQLALDRYWKRKKTRWQVGRDYERYVGYIYEMKGYKVHYKGILEGFDDLGRDLVCKKGKNTLVIQCKRWSRHKTIHENHVNQLYGTVVKYILDHPDEKVDACFYTTTNLSMRAIEFAKYLMIKVYDNFPFEEYPSIKCNISKRDGERIYHLPFDQQYDKTIIEPEKDERYVKTVKEAERLGFRRAWRWHGDDSE